MKRLKKEVLAKKSFYPKYLKLVNVILPEPLTPKEIEQKINGHIKYIPVDRPTTNG